MKYVKFGTRSGLTVSRVSLGAMRLGTDPEKAVRIIRTAIDNGVNYIDTSPFYLDGKSEEFLGLALQDGYREKVVLSSKFNMPQGADKRQYRSGKVRRMIEQSLKRLKTDYLDYFQLWLVHSYQNFKDMCAKGRHFDAIKQAMKEGIVKRTGITGHPPAGDFPKMFKNEIFEICTISYNYLKREMEQDIKTLSKMGVGVVIMNPCGGGTLVENSSVLKGLLPGNKHKLIELAYRYVLGTEGVSTVLAGMDTAAHAQENAFIGSGKPLAAQERKIINKNTEMLLDASEKICTGCNYCKDCPQEIKIGKIFEHYFRFKVFGQKRYARSWYSNYLAGKGWNVGSSPEECTECGKCEKICPNSIPIIQQLKDAHKDLKPRE